MSGHDRRRLPFMARWHRNGAVGLAAVSAVLAVAAALTQAPSGYVLGFGALGVLTVVGVLALPWHRVRRRRPPILVWPGLVLAELAVLGLGRPDAAQLVPGVIVLVFLYVGVCQPVGRAWFVVPVAAVPQWLVIDAALPAGLLRLAIAITVWVLVAEVVARQLLALRRSQLSMAAEAATDVLTGLGNRRNLEAALAACDPESSLLLFDLDGFKQVNDLHGHPTGDRLLAEFGALVRSHTRRQDAAFRYGGDEFLVIVDRTDVAEAAEVAGRLVDAWHRIDNGTSVSVGIAAGGHGVLARADSCLYTAKARGGGIVVAEHGVAPSRTG